MLVLSTGKRSFITKPSSNSEFEGKSVETSKREGLMNQNFSTHTLNMFAIRNKNINVLQFCEFACIFSPSDRIGQSHCDVYLCQPELNKREMRDLLYSLICIKNII